MANGIIVKVLHHQVVIRQVHRASDSQVEVPVNKSNYNSGKLAPTSQLTLQRGRGGGVGQRG